MYIAANKVVTVHFSLKDVNQNTIENTYDKNQPLVYTYARGEMPQGFESQLSKATKGEKFSFSLMPAEGYGLRNINNTQRIPVKYLKHEGKLSTGKQIKVNTDTGVRHGTVIKVGKFNTDVDMNHPLAGKNLHFEVEVISVSDAAKKNAPDGQPPSCGCC